MQSKKKKVIYYIQFALFLIASVQLALFSLI